MVDAHRRAPNENIHEHFRASFPICAVLPHRVREVTRLDGRACF
ncbi:hypothetical protein N177_0697 [Lutibaculum baratangense AMV1]|uniref:Uncharacterized protein n=1 Tax=Lutibaculum baratangense AMV1 TaxID=631454 RepID=V4TME6_9HYPH|nr:hypothetical protein N177_0697 [Lutibaculum baratangense AMV1]